MSLARRWLIPVGGVALALLMSAGYIVYRDYNPYFMHFGRHSEAKALLDTCTKRPLSADEFDRSVGLCGDGDDLVVLWATTIVAVEAGRDPARRPAARAALGEVANNGRVRQRTRDAAAKTLARVEPDDAPPVPAGGAGVSQTAPTNRGD